MHGKKKSKMMARGGMKKKSKMMARGGMKNSNVGYEESSLVIIKSIMVSSFMR